MPNPLPSLLAGVVFGLALAAPPGPMNAVIAEESVNNGWLVGGALMCYFAYGAARDAIGDVETVPSGDGAARQAATGFRKAFVLALTNPYQILFWLTIGVGLLEPGELDVLSYTPYVGADLAGLLVVRTGSPALILGFFLGIALWITGFPAALRAAQRRVAAFAPAVAGASALVLAGFGVVFLVDAVRTLL